jgi:hypothetical protein
LGGCIYSKALINGLFFKNFSGDFDVPSSREDVDRDSSWNQWLRNEIHILFVEALDAFKVGLYVK